MPDEQTPPAHAPLVLHDPETCLVCIRVRNAVRDGRIACTHGDVSGWPPTCGVCTSTLPVETWERFARDGRWWAA